MWYILGRFKAPIIKEIMREVDWWAQSNSLFNSCHRVNTVYKLSNTGNTYLFNPGYSSVLDTVDDASFHHILALNLFINW